MYMVNAPVPADLATAIEPYRQRYDPLAVVIAPHITVLKSFAFPGSSEELDRHLDEIGETHAPIKVSIVGWDAYKQQRNYQVRLPIIAGRLEFMTLRNDLLAGPLSYLSKQQGGDYWPHITFGSFSDQAELERVKKALKGFEPQFIFRVTNLELFRQDKPTSLWQMEKRFALEATVLGSRRRKRKETKVFQIKDQSRR